MKIKKPKIKINIHSTNDSIKNLHMFLDCDLNNFTSNNIINYFGMNRNNLNKNLDKEILNTVEKFYDKNKLINQKNLIQKVWEINSEKILKTISLIFDCEYIEEQEYNINVSINPVCPRFLKDYSFDVWVEMTETEILNNIIHELLHFFWFKYWDNHIYELQDSDREFLTLTWALSEIAIDALITQTPLHDIVVNDKPAYNYFYDLEYDGQNLILYLRKLFNDNPLVDFMKNGLEIISTNSLKNLIIQ